MSGCLRVFNYSRVVYNNYNAYIRIIVVWCGASVTGIYLRVIGDYKLLNLKRRQWTFSFFV